MHFVDDGYKILEFDDFDWEVEGDSKMNYIKQFAKMLGVEVGEEFNIILESGDIHNYSPYKITEDGFKDVDGDFVNDETLSRVLTGSLNIQKLPWKPKEMDTYYYVAMMNGCVQNAIFSPSCSSDLLNYKLGNIFKTREDAESNRCKILAELKEIKEELK